MQKKTDIQILEASLTFEPVPFRAPLKFGGRVVERTDLINVEVIVETRDGEKATGMGSMPVGNVWSWPTDKVSIDETERMMKAFAETIVELADSYTEWGHPVDIVYHLSGEYQHQAKMVAERLGIAEVPPFLAQLVAASPLDAAIHDAYGRVHERSSFATLGKEFMHFTLEEYLDEQFEGEYLEQYVDAKPKARMPLYHLVGALDPLTEADIEQRINDELPETLPEWIVADGLTHLKIKLSGDDFDWDIDRVLAIDRVAAEAQAGRGCEQWWYSLDFNERCPNVEHLLAFLKKLREQAPRAYERIQYLEQPTSRHLEDVPEQNMSAVAEMKPVVIDESLVDYDALLMARKLGYSGVALKACKGQTESLLMAAAARKFGMFLCVQDLTCPGFSFLHSAALAAHIPTVAAIEGNGRQYCPAPNAQWARQFPGMFEITDGSVETGLLSGEGLGF